jgi:hypothetical protein
MSMMMVGASTPQQPEFYSGAAAFRTRENDPSLVYIGASKKNGKLNRVDNNLSQMMQEFSSLNNLASKYAPLVDLMVQPFSGYTPKPTSGMQEKFRREGTYGNFDHLNLY